MLSTEATMTKHMISFPSGAMQLQPDEFEQASVDSHTVVREAKEAGVWVFGGGVNESTPPVRVDAERNVAEGTNPETAQLAGGYTILELPTIDEAYEWAAKFAKACRCQQEVRAFWNDPES